MGAVITAEHRDRLAASGEAGRYLARILQQYGEFYREVVFDEAACRGARRRRLSLLRWARRAIAPAVAAEIDTRVQGRGQPSSTCVVPIAGTRTSPGPTAGSCSS